MAESLNAEDRNTESGNEGNPAPATSTAQSLKVSHHQAVVNGVRLHYVEAGEGPLVLLLHGYPEFWYSWRNQIPALAAAGFHVIAPDMRGYNLSEKPPGVHSYDIRFLAADAVALIRHVQTRRAEIESNGAGSAGDSPAGDSPVGDSPAGGTKSLRAGRATIIGHDWGGAVAWAVAMMYPQVVDKLIVLNAPHPVAFLRELRKPAQLARSWYMFFFQLPWLPEMMVRARRFAMLRGIFRTDPARRGAFSRADIGRYVQAMAQPGALTATINYYRAIFRHSPRRATQEVRRIKTPAMLIWGEKDRYLGTGLTRGLEAWVPRLRLECLPNASHWVQHDEPQRVNQLIIEFLRSDS